MNSDPVPPGKGPSDQSGSLTSAEKREDTSSWIIGKKCVEQIEGQLPELSLHDNSPRTWGVDEGIPIPVQAWEILRQGAEQEKRFLTDIEGVELSGIEEEIDPRSFSLQIIALRLICAQCLSFSESDDGQENETCFIYIYFVCLKRPHAIYQVILRDFPKIFRIRKAKFVTREELCIADRVKDLERDKRFRNKLDTVKNRLKGYLKELLDLESSELNALTDSDSDTLKKQIGKVSGAELDDLFGILNDRLGEQEVKRVLRRMEEKEYEAISGDTKFDKLFNIMKDINNKKQIQKLIDTVEDMVKKEIIKNNPNLVSDLAKWRRGLT